METVDGIEAVQQELNDVIVEARWPRIGWRQKVAHLHRRRICNRASSADIGMVQNALDFIDRKQFK